MQKDFQTQAPLKSAKWGKQDAKVWAEDMDRAAEAYLVGLRSAAQYAPADISVTVRGFVQMHRIIVQEASGYESTIRTD